MKHAPDADEMLLGEIRASMSPTAAEEGRLRARLGAALGTAALPAPGSLDAPLGGGATGGAASGAAALGRGVSGGGAGGAAALEPGVNGTAALGSTAAASTLLSSGLRLGLRGLGKQLVAAGLVAASGFGLGYVAGRGESTNTAAQQLRALQNAAALKNESPPAGSETPRGVLPGPRAASEDEAARQDEHEDEAAAKEESAAAGRAGDVRVRRAGAAVHASADAAVTNQADADEKGRRASLDEEALQLRRVGRALRNGHPLLALKLLDDLDIRVPKGILGEERLAARLMARCLVGDRDAPGTAAAWLRQHPKSVYAPRVRASCPEPNETAEEELERP